MSLGISFRFLFALWVSACVGKSYFVSPEGVVENDGSSSRPWKTIQQAITAAQPGDSVIVKRGVYMETITFPRSGTIEMPIVLSGEGEVVINGMPEQKLWSGILNIRGQRHITIQNIQFHNAYWFGVYIDNQSSDIVIQHCKTYNTGASGIYAGRSTRIHVLHNVVQKACYQSQSEGSQECISLVSISDFEAAYNEVFESGGSTNGGEGIDVKEGCTKGIVHNNVVHDLIRLGIYVDAWDKELSYVSLYNNRVYNCASGIAISSENAGTARDIMIFNNLVYHTTSYGIAVTGWEKNGKRRNIKIVNNTCFRNGKGKWGGGIIVEQKANADSIFIHNNLCFDNLLWGIAVPNLSQNKVSHNLIYPYLHHFWTNEVKGKDAVLADPLLADTATGNLMLKANSPAIHNGNPRYAAGFDFTGKERNTCCVDIGAYQH